MIITKLKKPAIALVYCFLLLISVPFTKYCFLFYVLKPSIFNKLPRSKLRGISLDLASLGIFVKRSKLRGIRPVSD